jgi:hypothetical protein
MDLGAGLRKLLERNQSVRGIEADADEINQRKIFHSDIVIWTVGKRGAGDLRTECCRGRML